MQVLPIRKHQLPWIIARLVILATLSTSAAFALQLPQASYAGGTIPTIPQGTPGTLDTTSPTTLIFRNSIPASTAQIGIPYTNIRSMTYSTEVAHHLGVLPAIGASLFTHRQRRYIFTIIYTDDAGTIQSVLIEVPKEQTHFLWPMLRARSPICQNKPSPCVQLYFQP